MINERTWTSCCKTFDCLIKLYTHNDVIVETNTCCMHLTQPFIKSPVAHAEDAGNQPVRGNKVHDNMKTEEYYCVITEIYPLQNALLRVFKDSTGVRDFVKHSTQVKLQISSQNTSLSRHDENMGIWLRDSGGIRTHANNVELNTSLLIKLTGQKHDLHDYSSVAPAPPRARNETAMVLASSSNVVHWLSFFMLLLPCFHHHSAWCLISATGPCCSD